MKPTKNIGLYCANSCGFSIFEARVMNNALQPLGNTLICGNL